MDHGSQPHTEWCALSNHKQEMDVCLFVCFFDLCSYVSSLTVEEAFVQDLRVVGEEKPPPEGSALSRT